MSRVYLGARDSRSPEALTKATVEALTDWQETVIRNALGQRFRAGMRVGLRRPWWMPGPLYHLLLASIVTEHGWRQTK